MERQDPKERYSNISHTTLTRHRKMSAVAAIFLARSSGGKVDVAEIIRVCCAEYVML